MKIVQKIALVLIIIGAINWALVGLFDFNLVTSIFGEKTLLTKVIYLVIGISGIFSITTLFSDLNVEKH